MISCVSVKKKTDAQQPRAQLYMTTKKRVAKPVDNSSSGSSNVTTIKNDSVTTYITDVEMDKDGKAISVVSIDEIVVTSSYKSIPERFGYITIDFTVSVPKELQRKRWSIILTPVIKQHDSIIRLDPVVLRGEALDLLQRRQKWQHDEYQKRVAKIPKILDDTLHKRLHKHRSRQDFFYTKSHEYHLPMYDKRIDHFAGKKHKDKHIYHRRAESFGREVGADDKVLSLFESKPEPRTVARVENLAQSVEERKLTHEQAVARYSRPAVISALANNRAEAIKERSASLLSQPRIQTAKMDSLVVTPQKVNYYYSQQMKTDEYTSRMSLTLSGVAKDLRGRVSQLPTSDTLTYSVASVISFIDHAPRYVYKVISKYATVNDVSWINFPVGKSVIIDELGDNKAELEKMKTLMHSLLYQYEFFVDSVVITAASSPEGAHDRNQTLSQERAMSIRKYLVDNFNNDIDTLLKVRWIGEDWDRLLVNIKKNDKLKNRDAIAEIISQTSDPDSRDAIIARKYPADFAVIKNEMYPKLRSVSFKYSLRRVGMVQDTVYTTEIDSAYMKGIEFMTKRRYVDALRILEPYADINTAIVLMSLGYDERAIEIMESTPSTANRDYMLAILCSRKGRLDDGLAYFEQACNVEPRFEYRANLDPEIQVLLRHRDKNKPDN